MSAANYLRIMLVDDHAVVRSGIRRLLEQDARFNIVAEAESGEKAYQLFSTHLPDLTVMDLTMPGMGGLEAIRRIVARFPDANILVLSMHENAAFANHALKAGAKGYLTKSDLAEELTNALEKMAGGKIYISSEMARKICFQSAENEGNPMLQLSTREFEIFNLLADGQDIDKISHALNISCKTVSNYQTAIKQKLGINSPVDIFRIAIRYGLITI